MGLSTAFCATLAALVLVYLGLSRRVILLRHRHKVGIGDGGHPDLARAIRVHSNFAEWVPLALLALLAADLRGGSDSLVAVLGAVLVLARVAHAEGLTRTSGSSPFRTAGVGGTSVVMVVACLAAVLGG